MHAYMRGGQARQAQQPSQRAVVDKYRRLVAEGRASITQLTSEVAAAAERERE